MKDESLLMLATGFFDRLKEEIASQAQLINIDNDGDLQDGFCLQDIDEGWVTYKGMSWGIALQPNPVKLHITYGPDWPFVGHPQTLKPRVINEQFYWSSEKGEMIFATPYQLARYGLEMLAKKAHDSLPIYQRKAS